MIALCVDFRHLPAVISFSQATADKREVDHRAGFSPEERWFLSVDKHRDIQQRERSHKCLTPLLRLRTASFHCPGVKIASYCHWAAAFCIVNESTQHPYKVFLLHNRRHVTAVEMHSAYLHSLEGILRVFHDLLEAVFATGPDGC